MKVTTIKSDLQGKAQYLSNIPEFKNDLPHNCVFNKGITGCGGTTVAISNTENYIICVPTKELIKNKCHIETAGVSTKEANLPYEVFGWFGSIKKGEANVEGLKEYLAKDGVKKIMLTYHKLNDILSYINPKDFNLLVDEYHCLSKMYEIMKEEVKKIFHFYKEFKSYCFMSATPVMEAFIPSALRELDIVEVAWTHKAVLKPFLIPTNNPYAHLAAYINNIKKNGYVKIGDRVSKHLFIFLNSVSNIMDVIKHCDLTQDDVRIICGEKNTGNIGEFKVESANYYGDIKNLTDDEIDAKNKMITFLTSTAFQGADFWCSDALSIVVTNTRNPTTCLDITTDIPQIAGRFRPMATKPQLFGNIILHVYNTAKKSIFSEFSAVDIMEKVIAEFKADVDKANTCLEDKIMVEVYKGKFANNPYITFEYGKFFFDEDGIRYKYQEDYLNSILYKSGTNLRNIYVEQGSSVTWEAYTKWDAKVMRDNLCTFKTRLLAYEEARINDDNEAAEHLAKAYSIEVNVNGRRESVSLVWYIYEAKLMDKARELKYSMKQITRYIDSLDNTRSAEAKIAKEVSKAFTMNKFYSSKEIKNILGTIFENYDSSLGVPTTKKVPATTIEKYFNVEETSTRVDGKKTRGYFILSPKVSVNPMPEKKEEIIVEDKQTKVDWDAVAYNEAIQEVEYNKQEKYVADYISQATGCDLQDILSWAALCGFDTEMVTRVYNNIKK